MTPALDAWAEKIKAAADQGLSSREVSQEHGISHQRVCYIARRYKIDLARPGLRRFSFYISDSNAEIVRALAQEAGVSPTAMCARIVGIGVEGGIEPSRKRLGKLVIPAGTYNKAGRL